MTRFKVGDYVQVDFMGKVTSIYCEKGTDYYEVALTNGEPKLITIASNLIEDMMHPLQKRDPSTCGHTNILEGDGITACDDCGEILTNERHAG